MEENNNQQTTQGEKTFTQDEVNEIVKNRLARAMKQKADAESNPLAEKEKELAARELRLNAREMVASAGLPGELANVLNCKDETELKEHVELLKKYYSTNTEKKNPKGFQFGAPNDSTGEKGTDSIRKAMGLN